MKSNIFLTSALAGLLMMSSCSDFLEQTNTTQANEDTFYDNDEAVAAAVYPLYNYCWNNFNNKFSWAVGDGRANNITAQYSDYVKFYCNFTETSLTEGLEEAWGSLYLVVSSSNNVINAIKASSGPSETAKIQGMAEARFMRGVAYWYIGSIWGRAILYTDTKYQQQHAICPAHRQTDVMEFAIRDLEYAAANLPQTQSQTGRVNSYSAYGLLSRIYLSMAGLTTEGEYDGTNIATDYNRATRNPYYLDLARKAALKCIEGPFKLMDDYEDLFNLATQNNNSESVFQLQFMAGDPQGGMGFGCNNQMTAFFGWSTMIADGNWGGSTFASYDLVKTYDAKDRKRRHATICTYGESYPKLGGYTYPTDGDGIGEKAREQCNIIKHVYGTHAMNGQTYLHNSGANAYMMRLAEVYLNLAEAVMGNNASTSDETALTYYNAVRTRAGMETKRTITYDDIHYERRIELAMEGQYWYDLLRRSYYKRQEVLNYVNSQHRNCSYEFDETEPSQYAFKEEGKGVSTATEARFTFPFSDVDLTRNPKLGGEPVAYEFGEKEVTAAQLFN
ncbi:MAG: RagB/SusD family nutrient uptake outer membrane protein [Duncaniella sp.]|nr:RagB/SusD family nutrient uptake outer membrane protein [Duncaniella sp.]